MRRSAAVLLSTASLIAALSGRPAAAEDPTVKLRFLGARDTYNPADDEGRGGFARLNAVARAERAANPEYPRDAALITKRMARQPEVSAEGRYGDHGRNGMCHFAKGAGRFPWFSGVQLVFDPSAEPGSDVSSLIVGTDPIKPDRLCKVAVSDYILGDGYSALGCGRIIAGAAGGRLASDVMADVQKAGKGTPKVDGRISRTGK